MNIANAFTTQRLIGRCHESWPDHADSLPIAPFAARSPTTFTIPLIVRHSRQTSDWRTAPSTLRRNLFAVTGFANSASCARLLAVNFREVVHSVRTGNADVAKP